VTAGPWRERAYRWRWWLAALGLVLVVRAALPEVLRRVIVSQASEALHAKVDVGDVDLRLWRGGVALEDVAVRPLGAPDRPPPPPDADPKAVPPAFDEYSPILGFKRFAVELRFLPLFSKTVQVRGIELDSPRVALDRLASGDLNLLALVPKQEVTVEAGATPGAAETPPPTPTASGDGRGDAAADSGWNVGLDQFILSDGRIRFRDLALEGSEPVELGIDRIAVEEIGLSPAVYGKPGRIKLKLGIDEGSVDVDARVTLDGAKVKVTTEVTANRLPLRRARLYVPKVGWSDLRGELDLGLTYELEEAKTNALHGTLALRDVSVAVPDLEDVAIGWKSLTVNLERIDFLAQRAAVQEVALDGAVVTIRLHAGELLPALAQRQAGQVPTPAPAAVAGEGEGAVATTAVPSAPVAENESSPTPAGTAVEGTPSPARDAAAGSPAAAAGEAPPPPAADAADEPPAPPWHWQVASIKLTNSKVRVLSTQAPVDVGVELAVANLSGEPDAIAHVTLGLALQPGTLALDGDLRLAAVPAFGGTLKIADLALPPLLAVSGAAPAELLPSAILRSDLVIAAGLAAPGGGEAPADRLRVSGTLGVGALRVAPPHSDGLTVALQDLDLRIDQLLVPGIIPPGQTAAAGAAIDVGLSLTLREAQVARSGAQALAVAVPSLVLTVPTLAVPASLAQLGPGDGVPIVTGEVSLDLDAPRIALGADDTTAQAKRIALRVSGLSLPVAPPPAASAAPAAAADAAAVPVIAPPTRLALQLDLSELQVATAQGKDLNAVVQAIALALTDVVVPGFVAGAPPAPSSEPLRAGATLTLTEPRLTRADGKEFAVSAKTISIPLQSVALPGVPGGTPPGAVVQPLRAVFGEIRLEAPAIRVTRTKDGLVLPAAAPPPAGGASAKPAPSPSPAAAPAASPVATQPLELQVAALRILRGGLEFTDRAVQPVFSTRFAPIEVDARDIRMPGPRVTQLNIDIASVEQGKITVRGSLSPEATDVTVDVDQLALLPFNPYATTYSPYGIADGALSIKSTAKGRGGKVEVHNDITLHQFDLAGSEGDALFEQNFGIPLSMALALLRDLEGNIDLGVRLAVDREGNAQVDVMAVARSALRQAITGAVTSPLKMLGAVAGGTGAPIAPAPVAFRLGRAEATAGGVEAAERLAAFLASRPAMGVQLTSGATAADARWLHEHALLGAWAEQGFFERSLAFVTASGPRQRIRDYLEARVADQTPELAAEDAAQLDQWLAEVPPPTAADLQGLADARLTAVETVLVEQGTAATRSVRGPTPTEPPTGAPSVTLRLQPASRGAAAVPPPQP